METKIEDICSKLDTHITDNKEDNKLILKKLDDMHIKFASKWVEKGLITVATLVTASLIYGLIQVI